MSVCLFDTFGSASIGVFIRVTEKYIIIPKQIPNTKGKRLEEWFGIKTVKTSIGYSVLAGALVCANSNGMILPSQVQKEEFKSLRSIEDINITIAETKKNAYGNMVLANDYGAIVDPRTTKEAIKMISDTLAVEAVKGEVAGLPYVGALATVTNKGMMVHPLAKESEKSWLIEILKVPLVLGTVNCGIPYIATGLIGNSKAAVAGSLTTGPELFMISQALDLVN